VLEQGEAHADAKSIMGLMMLAATQGTRLQLITDGTDAEEASNQVQQLIADRFGEDE
jgi:phosphocarrier protein